MASTEEKVEAYYKAQLDSLEIRHYGKTESINRIIEDAMYIHFFVSIALRRLASISFVLCVMEEYLK